MSVMSFAYVCILTALQDIFLVDKLGELKQISILIIFVITCPLRPLCAALVTDSHGVSEASEYPEHHARLHAD